MADTLANEIDDGAVVITIDEERCTAIWPTIDALIQDGYRAFVLDFSSVRYLNSMSIAQVISSRNKAAKVEARLALADLDERIRAIFSILKLQRLFDLDLDRGAAIAALRRTT